ncbi:uncharacterized protein LOC143538448 [Bidens hawaiensis]|uniref:uncharacterized protein LOC143538448 n=1 Tax=Bidens hawaiensis TaxID=980011 RepID=UPI004049DBF0
MAGELPLSRPWIIDSGATEHITCEEGIFDLSHLKQNVSVTIPNGKSIPVKGIGNVTLPNGLKINNVFKIPEFKCNLLSVGKLTNSLNSSFTFYPSFCYMQDLHSRRLIGIGKERDGLYWLEPIHKVKMALAVSTNPETWHRRLGHASKEKLQHHWDASDTPIPQTNATAQNHDEQEDNNEENESQETNKGQETQVDKGTPPLENPEIEINQQEGEQGAPPNQTFPTDTRRGTREKQRPKHLSGYHVDIPSSINHSRPIPTSETSMVHPFANDISYDKFSTNHKAYLAAITSHDEPKHFSRVVKDLRWREAMQREIHALESNKTWTLEQLPPGKKVVNSKWVYKVKYKPNGDVECFKARLVARGFTQTEGVDFHETFASVAKLVTVRHY